MSQMKSPSSQQPLGDKTPAKKHLDRALKDEHVKDFEDIIELHKTYGGD